MSGKPKWGQAPEGYRHCSACGTMLELNSENFHYCREPKSGSKGFQYRCKTCIKKANAQARDNGNWKRYHYKSLYSLTLEKRDLMLEAQRGLCAICLEPMKRACVDHDHNTGKIRGMLCDACNNGLGRFKDNVLHLQAAIRYLQESGDD